MPEYKMGLDVGSTTVKLVVLDQNDKLIWSRYTRHFSDIRGVLTELINAALADLPDIEVAPSVTGSGGLSVSKLLGLPFVQEVVAETFAVEHFIPRTDVVLELGGEDAKITYMRPNLEQRMNGTCAGGTGAFIDQMATLLHTDPSGLNELAKSHRTIYPIAARCGVFAKTDIQPLLNEGADKEDIAASVFASVVTQTITGLACGRPIRGTVAFLGGPLHYLTELRKQFIQTLALAPENIIDPPNSHLFVAMGAALLAEGEAVPLRVLASRLSSAGDISQETRRLAPLFNGSDEYEDFIGRHSKVKARRATLSPGPCYLGIDAGSTTIKACLIDADANIVFSYYSSNKGTPVGGAAKILRELYSRLPEGAYIASACSTGYGEAIIKEALRLDMGEIETVAHYTAASYFDPEVSFIMDIGGQDMKCLRIKNGAIDGIMLNEACSSGCGSFIETFALSLGLTTEEFAAEALTSKSPVDLGTRCTVFMNSRVKQAQKEGATVGDISAGLSYSVIRNALYKVIKIRDVSLLGKHVVVQGGTFLNDAILRAFENELGVNAVRPDIAGLMGAYGAALIAKKRGGSLSTILSMEELEGFKIETKPVRCNKCSNHCQLSVSYFGGGRKFISGNKCERGGGAVQRDASVPDLFEYKYARLFDYEPASNATRGVIGIPRVLNIYENYPFWFTLLTKLSFRVELSARSSRDVFKLGMETIPSESVCYPAKMAHGAIADLLGRGIKTIFYPCVPYEQREFPQSDNNYNCPIVTSYPEVIKNNIDALREDDVVFMNPFFALDNRKKMKRRVHEEFKSFGVTYKEACEAVDEAYAEQKRYKQDICREGRRALEWARREGKSLVILAGRPYHCDPEINHGLPQVVTSLGMGVLTEDSVANMGFSKRPIRVVDQWAYHTRLYECAQFAAKTEGVELVQITSFGCGLDAITSDQVQEIIESAGKIYTLLKIDEINNLGAAKIRLRSLAAALKDRKRKSVFKNPGAVFIRRAFTKKMRKNNTIIAPQMSPIHFQFLSEAFKPAGYDLVILEDVHKSDVDVGLKYVNNDACYPSILVVGQLVNAFLSGKYDPNTTSVMITQTGGGCRATNYIAFLRKALRDAGFPQVSVISLNFAGIEKDPGFKVSLGLGNRAMIALSLGDLLLNVFLRVHPYQVDLGESEALYAKWVERVKAIVKSSSLKRYKQAIRDIISDFSSIRINEVKKPRVGVVGEILVKFHPMANNNVMRVVENEGGECVVPGLLDFIMYAFFNSDFKHKMLGKSLFAAIFAKLGIKIIEMYRKPMIEELRKTGRFCAPLSIYALSQKAKKVLSIGNTTGEGWFLTAEMIELIESGTPNIICVQPFACLPNHVTGKGMIKEVRRQYPGSNIVPVDYDPGASEVNQLNRIKLMIHSAFANMERGGEAKI